MCASLVPAADLALVSEFPSSNVYIMLINPNHPSSESGVLHYVTLTHNINNHSLF